MANNQLMVGSDQTLDESLNTLISEFRLTSEYTGVMRSCATDMKLEAHSGRSKIIDTFGKFTAQSLSYGEDIVNAQEISDRQTSYSPNEVGLKVIIPDLTLRRIADPDFYGKIGQVMATAYRNKEDKDGCDQLSSFTSTNLGAAGTALSLGLIHAASARIKTGSKRRTSTTDVEPPPAPHYGIFHSYSLSRVMGTLVPFTDVPTGTNDYDGASANAQTIAAGTNGMTESILRQGTPAAMTLDGLKIKAEDNLLVDSSDDCTGAVFARQGLVFVSELDVTEKVEKDASARAKEVVMYGSYTWGVYKPDVYGIPATLDATQPS